MNRSNSFIILILYILIILIVYIIYYNNIDKFDNVLKNKTAFCLLTRKPNIIWLNFLNTFLDDYDVYVVIDEPGDYSDIINKNSKINLIQISDEVCLENGYYNSDYMFKPVVSTDRAYYYFNKINNNYSHIWFCEDDVLLNNKDMLISIDKKYKNIDFIVPGMEINTKGTSDKRWMHWNKTENFLPLPWAHWIICLCRISKNLMKKVDEFVIKHGKLNYKEFLFHTLALHNNMNIEIPVELKESIKFLNVWTPSNITPNITYNPIYHPVKDINYHEYIRQNIINQTKISK